MAEPGRSDRGAGGGLTIDTLRELVVDDLLHANGDQIDLVLDVGYDYFCESIPNMVIVKNQLRERNTRIYQLWCRPLEIILHSRHVKCICSPISHLRRMNIVISGSVAERLDISPVSSNYHYASDVDIMVELGPVSWTLPGAENSCPVKNVDTGGSGPVKDTDTGGKGPVKGNDAVGNGPVKDNADDAKGPVENTGRRGNGPVKHREAGGNCRVKDAAEAVPVTPANVRGRGGDCTPRLTIVETANAGFVLLMQERKDGCPHHEGLTFKAETVRQMFSESHGFLFDQNATQHNVSGPAVSSTAKNIQMFQIPDRDEVPCLHVPVWWISDEFFTRQRQNSWPPESIRENIRKFGLHLVPVGAPGSDTESVEFRISFSRAELVVASLLTDHHRRAVIAFKICKFGIENGSIVKSYYIKTTLFWLCEQTSVDEWTGVSQSVIKLLDFLDKAVSAGRLPCYFWSDLNLLRFTTRNDRLVLQKALQDIRTNLQSLLGRWLGVIKSPLLDMLTLTPSCLTEHQVRVCLARLKILKGLYGSLVSHLELSKTKGLHRVLPELILSGQLTPHDILRVVSWWRHWYYTQTGLLEALAIAPECVTSQVRLSSTEFGFTWDAGPLLGLLTEEDLQKLLGDPEKVRVWLRRQRHLPETKRPPGLPADLRSARDLCDLLLNIPLLSWTLHESVPQKWHEYMAWVSCYSVTWPERVPSAERRKKITLRVGVDWMTFRFYSYLHMNPLTALLTALPAVVELRRHCDDPATAEEHDRIRRSLPDPWQLRRLFGDFH